MPIGTSFRFIGGFRYVVSVIFLVLSPPEPHLEVVSSIAAFVRDALALAARSKGRLTRAGGAGIGRGVVASKAAMAGGW